MSETATVSARAIQAERTLTQWDWVSRIVWMERMLAALGNGVKGSKWLCRWPNAHFAELGILTVIEARMSASQPR